MTRLALAALLALVLPLAALAQVAGSYAVEGRNPDGSAYGGSAEVTQTADGNYAVSWQVGSSYSGTGRLQGQVLYVDWGDTDPAVYVVMPDGELHGTWADGRALERWQRR